MKTPRNSLIRQDPGTPGVFIVCTLLGLLTLAVFWPVRTFDFVAYDDQQYVTSNPAIQGGLNPQNIVWAFQAFHAANWHPLTWVSHMLDVQFFGLNAGGHHFSNLLLHIANAILLLLVLKRLTNALWPSAFVAALFALHPMHVESVVWVAERKDVLSTFFFMLTLWAYARYAGSKVQGPRSKVEEPKSKVQSPGSKVKQQLRAESGGLGMLNYWLALLFFTLGLLSKPMLVTLPFVLLLLDYWPLKRFVIEDEKSKIKKVIPVFLEKVPFFLLAIGSSVVTFLAQRSGGSVASLQLFSFESRVANALAAYASYLEKLIWPAKLAVLYLPPEHWPFWRLTVAVLLLGGITMLAIWQVRLRPYLIVGWLWFLGTLVPVIGLVQVGSQYMADRYSYVPFIGCFICVAWGCRDLAKHQSLHWGYESKNGSKKDPSPRRSPFRRGEGESSTVKEAPGIGETLAVRFMERGVLWAGSLLVIAAAALTTRNQLAYWHTSESLFRHCVEVTTDNYIAYNNVGAILVNQGKYAEAKPFYAEALRINPAFPDTVMNMGTLLAIQGDVTNAVRYLQQSVQLAPESAECYGKLAVAFSEQGRIQEAVFSYRESLRLKPDQVPACNNLAWILATHPDAQLRNGSEAISLAEHACQLTRYKEPMLVGTLAAAYAEAGRFPEAASMAEKAIKLANTAGQKELANKNRELIELYRAGKAYHEQSVSKSE